jgi:hypothetical protein
MYSKSKQDLTSILVQRGKKISKAFAKTRFYPEDGALVQYFPIGNNLTIGTELTKDNDPFFQNQWLLIPMMDSIDQSSPQKHASYDVVKEYLEEFIVCTKACLEAYKHLKGSYPSVNSASSDFWLANNYMAVYFSIEREWDVKCLCVETDPNKCELQVERSLFEIRVKYNKTLIYPALAIGILGIVLLASVFWFLGLLCLGISWFLWTKT